MLPTARVGAGCGMAGKRRREESQLVLREPAMQVPRVRRLASVVQLGSPRPRRLREENLGDLRLCASGRRRVLREEPLPRSRDPASEPVCGAREPVAEVLSSPGASVRQDTVTSRPLLGMMTLVTAWEALEFLRCQTGEFDETVWLNLKWLALILVQLKRAVIASLPLVNVLAKELLEVFVSAQTRRGLSPVVGRQTLYVLRPSGPTEDAWEARRSLSEIQHCGRRNASSSTQWYHKGGRVLVRLSKCSALIQRYDTRCAELLPSDLAGSCKPSQPP